MMSLFTHSFQVLRGLPRPLLPGTTSSVTEWMQSAERATWPCHLSLRDLSTEAISSRPNLARRVAVGVSSRGLTPPIHQIMALSLRRKRCRSAEVGAQVSLPWSIAERTQALKTFPRIGGDRCLDVRMGRSFLNLPQAALHLAIIACMQPPPELSTSPR